MTGRCRLFFLLCIAKHANNARGEPNRVITEWGGEGREGGKSSTQGGVDMVCLKLSYLFSPRG